MTQKRAPFGALALYIQRHGSDLEFAFLGWSLALQMIRKILLRVTQAGPHDDIRRATGSAYCYAYRELPRQATSEQISNYCASTRRLFAPITKSFGARDNSVWVLRHYLSLKFVTAASLLAGSAQYAFERNLLIGVPYFNYYAVLNACRADLLTSPHARGNSWGQLIFKDLVKFDG